MDSQEQIFDRDGLIDRVGGDEELAKEVFDIYMEDTPMQIKALKKALEEDNQEEALRHSHSIKGSSSNVGAEEMRSISREIEMACKNGETETAKQLSLKLPGCLEKIKGALENA